jgi:hypothetical protein
MQPTDPEESRIAKIGLAFTRALVSGDYASAHRMLAPSLRDDLQISDLTSRYERMTSYWTAPADEIELIKEIEFWPGNEENDVGQALVGISSHPANSFVRLEFIDVRIVKVCGQDRIGRVIWGRP